MSRRRELVTALIVLVGVLAFAASPVAACRAAISMEEAVAHNLHIVIGTVSPAGDPYWYQETDPAGVGHDVIITPLDVVVVETLKGPALPGDTLRICQLGGQIGETRMFSTAEQYIGSGTYLLFLSPHWHHQAGLRVNDAWTSAGDTLGGNEYWPGYSRLSQLKAVIRDVVNREAGAPFGVAAGAEIRAEAVAGAGAEGAGDGSAGSELLDPGIVVVTGLLGGWAVQKLKVWRGRPGRQ